MSMIAALLAAWMAAAPAAPAVDLPYLPHERYRLENGLEVVLHHDDRYPLVAVRVVYHVGSMHDPAGKEGVAHLLEHAMAADKGSFHTSVLWEVAASAINASTGPTHTVYRENVPSSQLGAALWVESGRMSWIGANTRRSSIEKERAIVGEELAQRRVGSELTLATTGLFDLVFPSGHPLHLSGPKSLARITIADVREMASRHYGAGNATLVLAGDLPDDARAMVETYFGPLQGGAPPRPTRAAVALDKTVIAQVKDARARVPVLLVAWPSPASFEAGDAEADLAAALLGARTGGDADATDTTIAQLDADQHSTPAQSLFVLRVVGRPGTTPVAMLAELDAALERMAGGQLTELEVRTAAKRMIVRLHGELGSLDGRVDRMVLYRSANKPIDWVAEDEQRYRRATRQSVATFVGAWLHRRPRAIVQLQPATGGGR